MAITFPPANYKPTPSNALLANALDLSAPATDLLLKTRKNAWIQLAGHPDFFSPASQTTIWKRQLSRNSMETKTYRAFVHDSLKKFVPRFYREIEYNNEYFIEIDDLLQNFSNPAIMDIKMGTRTFLESEVENFSLRQDLYSKMVSMDPHEPSDQEHQQQGITKLRYMQYRESQSSSLNLGFRVEAIKVMSEGGTQKDWKKVRTEEQVSELLGRFFGWERQICKGTLKQLEQLRKNLETSKYFKTHELIGSSLLFFNDQSGKTGVWMIDFTKALNLPTPIKKLSHRLPWRPGNHEDGYLFGLDNLIQIIGKLNESMKESSSPHTNCFFNLIK